MGTIDRTDDTIAAFSSRGPSTIDGNAKPDIVAPGVGTESLSDPDSALYSSKSKYLLKGTVSTSYLPYLSMSGTSMAAPVVSGTVALMLQANPSLTPNAIKAILQYTAEEVRQYDPLTEGAGFLNSNAAVQLAKYLASPTSSAYPASAGWSTSVTWGNRRFHGGRLTAAASGWSTLVSWGAAKTPTGQAVDFGVICSEGCDAPTATWTVWDTADPSRNVVWGNTCGGTDCSGTWTLAINTSETVVWGTDGGGDTVVWGTGDGDTVVWGTGDGGDTVVWGTACADASCQVLWKK
jgi:subtilisin family serine protease